MAEPKYKLKKGTVRSPEEHRIVLQEIDALQRKRSAIGVYNSKKRLFNGISSTQYKKKRKPKETKKKIYDVDRFSRE